MKNRFCMIAVIALTLLVAMPLTAQRSGTRYKIPFHFQVGTNQLLAGEYRVSIVNDKALLISRIDGAQAVISPTEAPVESPGRSGRARLVFTCYGNKMFLTQAWPNSESGWEVPKSSAEVEYARTAQQRTEVVYSNNR